MILSARGMQFDTPAEKMLSDASESFYSELEKIYSDSCKKSFFRQNDHLDTYTGGLTHRLDGFSILPKVSRLQSENDLQLNFLTKSWFFLGKNSGHRECSFANPGVTFRPQK